MRVSMSAMGSVIVMSAPPASPSASPRCLRDARDLARVRHLPEADAAQSELAVHGPRAAAPAASRVGAHLELRLALLLLDQCFLCHAVETPTNRGGTENRAR